MYSGNDSWREREDWLDVGEIDQESVAAIPQPIVQDKVTRVFEGQEVSYIISNAWHPVIWANTPHKEHRFEGQIIAHKLDNRWENQRNSFL